MRERFHRKLRIHPNRRADAEAVIAHGNPPERAIYPHQRSFLRCVAGRTQPPAARIFARCGQAGCTESHVPLFGKIRRSRARRQIFRVFIPHAQIAVRLRVAEQEHLVVCGGRVDAVPAAVALLLGIIHTRHVDCPPLVGRKRSFQKRAVQPFPQRTCLPCDARIRLMIRLRVQPIAAQQQHAAADSVEHQPFNGRFIRSRRRLRIRAEPHMITHCHRRRLGGRHRRRRSRRNRHRRGSRPWCRRGSRPRRRRSSRPWCRRGSRPWCRRGSRPWRERFHRNLRTHPNRRADAYSIGIHRIAPKRAVRPHTRRISCIKAGRTQPPAARIFALRGQIVCGESCAILSGKIRRGCTRRQIFRVFIRHAQIAVRLRIAEQEHLVVCIDRGDAIPAGIPLLRAVIHACHSDGAPLRPRERGFQKRSVQPFPQRTCLPCDARIRLMIRLRVQPIAAQQQHAAAVTVKHLPLNGRFIHSRPCLRIHAEGHVIPNRGRRGKRRSGRPDRRFRRGRSSRPWRGGRPRRSSRPRSHLDQRGFFYIHPDCRANGARHKADLTGSERAILLYARSVVSTAAGRAQPPPARIIAVRGFIRRRIFRALRNGVVRRPHTCFHIFLVFIGYAQIAVRLRIAQQKHLFLGIVAALDVPFAVALAFAVIHLGNKNAAPLLLREGFVQEAVVQPSIQRAKFPRNVRKIPVIRLRVQPIAAQQQHAVAVPVEHLPLDGRFIRSRRRLRIHAKGHIIPDGKPNVLILLRIGARQRRHANAQRRQYRRPLSTLHARSLPYRRLGACRQCNYMPFFRCCKAVIWK